MLCDSLSPSCRDIFYYLCKIFSQGNYGEVRSSRFVRLIYTICDFYNISIYLSLENIFSFKKKFKPVNLKFWQLYIY